MSRLEIILEAIATIAFMITIMTVLIFSLIVWS